MSLILVLILFDCFNNYKIKYGSSIQNFLSHINTLYMPLVPQKLPNKVAKEHLILFAKILDITFFVVLQVEWVKSGPFSINLIIICFIKSII